MRTRPSSGAPAGDDSVHRASVAAYRVILRLYPRAFRDRWAEQAVLLFAELARRQPRGVVTTVRLWAGNVPDLTRGLVAEWCRELVRMPRRGRPALVHGALAGALLSTATVGGNLGPLWTTPVGRVVSWLISLAALTVLALTGRSTVAASGTVTRALRNGLLSGLIAFTSANLTATVIVLACFERLRHDSLQVAAFVASHESDFRAYQMHELLGAWAYGSIAGALLGMLGSAVAAALSGTSRHERHGQCV